MSFLQVPFLEVKNISKMFDGLTALSGINLTLNLGEVVGLVGDNGAGKSTLTKIISGNFLPSSGEILVSDKLVSFNDPDQAHAAGIAVVYQDLALAPNLNAVENIFLGGEDRYFSSIWSPLKFFKMRHRARQLLATLQSDSNIDIAVSRLSGGQRQAVAIARTLKDDAKLILMDEPLAAISVRQVKEVLALIRLLRDQGKAVLLISHRLDDIFAVCDRLIVLRRGEKVADGSITDFTIDQVMGYITGGRG